MKHGNQARSQVPAAEPRAIERVLQAERDAGVRIAQARMEAAATLERARIEALAIVNHALERGARWQQAHADLLEGRLQALRSEDRAAAERQGPPAAAALAAAVDRVAAQLVAGESAP